MPFRLPTTSLSNMISERRNVTDLTTDAIRYPPSPYRDEPDELPPYSVDVPLQHSSVHHEDDDGSDDDSVSDSDFSNEVPSSYIVVSLHEPNPTIDYETSLYWHDVELADEPLPPYSRYDGGTRLHRELRSIMMWLVLLFLITMSVVVGSQVKKLLGN